MHHPDAINIILECANQITDDYSNGQKYSVMLYGRGEPKSVARYAIGDHRKVEILEAKEYWEQSYGHNCQRYILFRYEKGLGLVIDKSFGGGFERWMSVFESYDFSEFDRQCLTGPLRKEFANYIIESTFFTGAI